MIQILIKYHHRDLVDLILGKKSFSIPCDQSLGTFTDTEIIRFKDTTSLLDRYQPWNDLLHGDASYEINKSLKQENYPKA